MLLVLAILLPNNLCLKLLNFGFKRFKMIYYRLHNVVKMTRNMWGKKSVKFRFIWESYRCLKFGKKITHELLKVHCLCGRVREKPNHVTWMGINIIYLKAYCSPLCPKTFLEHDRVLLMVSSSNLKQLKERKQDLTIIYLN